MARRISERADLLPVLGEIFRDHGFEAASLSVIGERTGLGKGSLYHFFPGGKEEMAKAVLDEIDSWFENEVFQPLREDGDAAAAIEAMLVAVDGYFRSGRRICLVGALALADARERFAAQIAGYFTAWQDALAGALARGGQADPDGLAEEILALIQGGLVLARARVEAAIFTRLLARLRLKLQPAG
ncbi:DNA-binding transcriptional regulator, AcrR family [Bosea sp. 62]|uniref:TetR/AcrR family transcriptional regulator n=1 Tax=unclassified Bosea (in: a-proteobacteria) TaxID=2653178 RepID=UPI00125BFBB0|nr:MULTISPECIES: TetR/AcrR family transcriptional regulator [unclassified Bosea (in: a-proteobacteria)]CAD5252730.1 DNA-binding transcriptional regulator, AcrR family [Bosea sp. 7B]CAD5278618.1 DNA-binding transcriptional regulator, AcrR family [Bosea sp. 21B]CAD5279719.1 DNA-binding transcriptional regulator, AcrR family [Bosea sp. 46]VVT59632.1 DNA-binding transcriptional regulator, AcrR family [Bosea sp. EC-HK365B]VXB37103.1 DNA-binding transcriptional regulator, AcrR family [Bosea sp. 62]